MTQPSPGGRTHLLIAVHGDFTLLNSGSLVRIADTIHEGIRRFDQVTLYSLLGPPAEPWDQAARERFAKRFPGVALVLEPRGRRMRLLTRIKNFMLMLAPAQAHRILGWSVAGATPRFETILAETPPPTILVHFADRLTILNGVPLDRVVVETHDIKFLRYAKRTGRALYRWSVLARARSELGVLARARAIIAISANEDAFFRTFVPDTPTFFVPSFAAGTPDMRPFANIAREVDLLFAGSNNPYNVEGLKFFLDTNASWLEGRQVEIAGTVCQSPEIQALPAAYPNVKLLGFVDDLRPVYARAKAVISPVEGTGLKIKVVEALAHGTPVLASEHSRQGLPPGYDRCVFPLNRAEIERVLDDDVHRRAAALAAITYIDTVLLCGRDKLADFLLRDDTVNRGLNR